MIRPLTAPTAPPTAAPRAAPCPPAAAAPIAAPLPAPIRPPPIVRWTGSYGLVQADNPRSSPTATTLGVICDFVIPLFQSDIVTRPKAGAYKRRTRFIHSEEWVYSDATGVCHFWYLSARVGLVHPLTVSILPSQQRSRGRLRPEPTGLYILSMIRVGYTGVRCAAGDFQKSRLPTSLLKRFLPMGYGLHKTRTGNDPHAPLRAVRERG